MLNYFSTFPKFSFSVVYSLMGILIVVDVVAAFAAVNPFSARCT
jgi:hypothetical protein